MQSHFLQRQIDKWAKVAQLLNVHVDEVDASITELFRTADDREDVRFLDTQSGALIALGGLSVSPWTGLSEGYVYALDDDDPLAVAGSLTTAVAQVSDRDGIAVWRAEVISPSSADMDRALVACRWRRHYEALMVSLRATPSRPESAGVHCRPTRSEDADFVQEMLSSAVWQGLTDRERTMVRREDVQAAVLADYLAAVEDDSMVSHVALDPTGRYLGHATARIQGLHPVLGVTEADLLDTAIVPSAHGHGIGTMLTAFTLHELRSRGVLCVYGTLDLLNTPPSRVPRIRLGLDSRGWQTVSTFWTLNP
jgi:GNAT superfamily N-acetyltransferase